MKHAVIIGEGGVVRLLDGAESISTSPAYKFIAKDRTYQATVQGTGVVTATVLIEVSNNYDEVTGEGSWVTLASISLNGENSDSDGASSIVPWKYTRANVLAIDGTGAAVYVHVGT
jgi:hypothetical protein